MDDDDDEKKLVFYTRPFFFLRETSDEGYAGVKSDEVDGQSVCETMGGMIVCDQVGGRLVVDLTAVYELITGYLFTSLNTGQLIPIKRCVRADSLIVVHTF